MSGGIPEATVNHKGTLDALKHAGLIVNDTRRWCEVMPVAFERGQRRMTVVELEDVP